MNSDVFRSLLFVNKTDKAICITRAIYLKVLKYQSGIRFE